MQAVSGEQPDHAITVIQRTRWPMLSAVLTLALLLDLLGTGLGADFIIERGAWLTLVRFLGTGIPLDIVTVWLLGFLNGWWRLL